MTGKKKNNKKLVILALLLLMIVGVSGYGVYSYFWTQGSFSATSNSVSIASFDPRVNINNNDFLGHGGDIDISCPSSDGNDTVYCTGSLQVTNNGGTDIVVEVYDTSADSANSHNLSASVGSPDIDWYNDENSVTISAGQSENLNISVPVRITSDFGSSSAVERNTSYDGDESSVFITTSFKLRVTQAH